MLDVEKIRKDFPMIQNHPNLIYFDNGATTFKPQCVIDAVTNFYTNTTSNVHRGDYPLSVKADSLYDNTRNIVARFLNCKSEEVAFLHNDTEVMNQIAYGLKSFYLHEGDVVLTTENEHASNLLPWYRLEKEIGIKVEYIPVGKDGVIHIEDAIKCMHDKVKVISVAEVTNVLGAYQPIKELCKLAHKNHAYMVVDGAQSVPHRKTDVQDTDIDFLALSAHKMCGPGGVGVLYGKYDLLEKMEPMSLGGGMNSRFEACGSMLLKPAPTKFEAGTPNIEGVIGLGAAVEYLESIGMDNISSYEEELRSYFASKVKELDNIEFYNPENSHGPVIFNAKGVFAQDAASFLSTKNVCVRSGNHCAKILHEIIGTDATIRASLYFYNTKEEVDKCVEAMKEISLENAVGIFF
jgi:cysteine desulfurase / selenocysteine lyase